MSYFACTCVRENQSITLAIGGMPQIRGPFPHCEQTLCKSPFCKTPHCSHRSMNWTLMESRPALLSFQPTLPAVADAPPGSLLLERVPCTTQVQVSPPVSPATRSVHDHSVCLVLVPVTMQTEGTAALALRPSFTAWLMRQCSLRADAGGSGRHQMKTGA